MIITTLIPYLQPLSPLLPPLHLVAFSTLLGTQLYQSTIITRVTFTSLPRGPFVRLQKSLWPVYFRIQTLLFLLSALTWSPVYAGRGLALVVGGLVSGLNWAWAEPWARRAMLEINEIGELVICGSVVRSADGSVGRGKEALSDEESPGAGLQSLKRKFKTRHAMSIHLNLISVIATLFHGWSIASKLKF